MPRLRVAYDSTTYRGLGRERFEHVRQRERGHGVRPAALYPVVEELASHLASPDDVDFGSAGMALERLGWHCAAFDGRDYRIEFVADAGQQIEHRLWGVDHGPQIAADFAGIVGAVAEARSPTELVRFAETFRSINERVSEGRADFADAISALAATAREKAGSPAAAAALKESTVQRSQALTWVFRSEYAVHSAARLMIRQTVHGRDRPRDTPEEAREVEIVAREFEMPLRMLNELVLGCVLSGRPLGRDSSIANDFRIAFATGKYARIGGLPIWLVTGDSDILEAADHANLRNAVWDKEDYFELLEDSTEVLDQCVRESSA
jgi:hypothetical protein